MERLDIEEKVEHHAWISVSYTHFYWVTKCEEREEVAGWDEKELEHLSWSWASTTPATLLLLREAHHFWLEKKSLWRPQRKKKSMARLGAVRAVEPASHSHSALVSFKSALSGSWNVSSNPVILFQVQHWKYRKQKIFKSPSKVAVVGRGLSPMRFHGLLQAEALQIKVIFLWSQTQTALSIHQIAMTSEWHQLRKWVTRIEEVHDLSLYWLQSPNQLVKKLCSVSKRST